MPMLRRFLGHTNCFHSVVPEHYFTCFPSLGEGNSPDDFLSIIG